MFGLTLDIFSALWFLAPVTVFTAFKVVVLALGAFPSTVRELEVLLHPPCSLLRLPGLLGIHGHEHWHLLVLAKFWFKIVDFLGKLVETLSRYERSSKLIELHTCIDLL